MGLLVTLSLINSNIYTNIDAPPERDFSQIEVWMIGVQVVIILALIEYGFLLAWKRFNIVLPYDVDLIQNTHLKYLQFELLYE